MKKNEHNYFHLGSTAHSAWRCSRLWPPDRRSTLTRHWMSFRTFFHSLLQMTIFSEVISRKKLWGSFLGTDSKLFFWSQTHQTGIRHEVISSICGVISWYLSAFGSLTRLNFKSNQMKTKKHQTHTHTQERRTNTNKTGVSQSSQIENPLKADSSRTRRERQQQHQQPNNNSWIDKRQETHNSKVIWNE